VGSLGLLHAEVGKIEASRYETIGYSATECALTALAPAVLVFCYHAVRAKRRVLRPNRPGAGLAVPALVFIPYLADYALYAANPSLRITVPTETLRVLFEYAQLATACLFALHAWLTGGVRAAVTFFVVGLLYGVVLENTGILLGFFSEPYYRHYIPGLPAPVATMVGWSFGIYCCIWIAWRLRADLAWFQRSSFRAALLATAAAIALDVQLDPFASQSGLFWEWNSLLPSWFLSVPFTNYAAWVGAFLPFAWAYFALEDRADLTEGRRNWRLLACVPGLAVAGGLLWLASMTVYEGGVSGPTYRILRAFLSSVTSSR
jgi:hypothetical protein